MGRVSIWAQWLIIVARYRIRNNPFWLPPFGPTEAGNSVINSYGQTHEIPNLYVARPGIFATSGASNPTYTIFAPSLRGAEQLATDWGAVAG